MFIIYSIAIFILGSSSVMVGYVWIRDIKNTKAQAANAIDYASGDTEDDYFSEELLAEYTDLIRRTA